MSGGASEEDVPAEASRSEKHMNGTGVELLAGTVAYNTEYCKSLEMQMAYWNREIREELAALKLLLEKGCCEGDDGKENKGMRASGVSLWSSERNVASGDQERNAKSAIEEDCCEGRESDVGEEGSEDVMENMEFECLGSSGTVTVTHSEVTDMETPPGEERYLEGLGHLWGTANDHREALECFQQSSAEGNADGSYWLGHMLYVGLGMEEQDQEAAVVLWTTIAEEGHSGAQFRLGEHYFEPYKWGLLWRSSADAIQEPAGSDNDEGWLRYFPITRTVFRYLSTGVRSYIAHYRALDTARHWYKLAAEAGCKKAAIRLSQVNSRAWRLTGRETSIDNLQDEPEQHS